MYIIKDINTDQRLSHYSPKPDLWIWGELILGGLLTGVHAFSTKPEAELAAFHLATFYQSRGEEGNFVIEEVIPVKAYKLVERNVPSR